MPKSAARQFLVSVAGIDGFFATKQGGETSSEASKVHDGGNLNPEVLTAPAQIDDLTVGRPYDPTRDGPVAARLRRIVGRWATSITVTPTDRDLVPVGAAVTYRGVLTRIREPEVNAESGDPSRIELVFAIESAG